MWIMCHLLWLAVEDAREKEVSMWIICELGVTGLISGLSAGRSICIWPGVFLLLFSVFSNEQVGYGDSWLILALGAWLSTEELLWMLVCGLGLAIGWALLVKKREIPLVPFLAAAYCLGEL